MSVLSAPKLIDQDEIPPLENGDHLDQETFHERYEDMPANVRAELIGGIVYMASPVRRLHSKEHIILSMWLANYEAATDGVEALSTPTVILSDDCEPQPDVALRLLKGKTTLVIRGTKRIEYIAGPPELVVEAASSSESIDLHAKRHDYEKYGVGEYIAFLVRTRSVVWLVREGKKFVDLKPAAGGVLRSPTFPGLWLDPKALIAGDKRRVNAVLNQGLATPEHAKFAADLIKHK